MTSPMMLTEVVEASGAVAGTRSRKAKIATLATCLTAAAAQHADLAIVASWLAGSPRQRRTGIGWRSVSSPPPPAETPSLTVAEVDAVLDHVSGLSGPGSATTRTTEVTALLERATATEQVWLRALLTGQMRQGALDSIVQDAVASATGIALPVVRRAAMMAGNTPDITAVAFAEGAAGLARIGLEVGRPVQPMLASSAPDLATALAGFAGAPVSVDAKLDGIRLQAHKRGDEVVLATRSLDVITDRLPEVVDIVRALPAETAVLDGEAMWLGDDGLPRPFQETASRTAQQGDRHPDAGAVTPYFFDLLHLDGTDLLDRPAHERWAALETLVPEQFRVVRLTTDDPAEAATFTTEVLAQGHEGVVVKDRDAPYEAGRRGAAWVKVKPVHTFDLVVLGIEWGSGRRRGWLSNIHLGARGLDGEFVMVGKAFKGMTDQMLAWQTERFTELALVPPDHSQWVVPVRPEQVVEIAIDGIQRSTRYPGGIALRFARVVRYRDDKTADEADTLEAIKAQFTRGDSPD